LGWTAETIWEYGRYKRKLPENADELEAIYLEKCKLGMTMFLEEKDEIGLPKLNPEYNEYAKHHIAGIL